MGNTIDIHGEYITKLSVSIPCMYSITRKGKLEVGEQSVTDGSSHVMIKMITKMMIKMNNKMVI